MVYLGIKIRKFRESLGLSRKEFASNAGIAAQTLYYIESDCKIIPSQETLDKIFKTYDINSKRFLRGIILSRNSRKIEINELWLRVEYLNNCSTTEEIANEVGCSRTTVLERMREYGIPRRPKFGHPEVKHSKTFDDCPELINLLRSKDEKIFLENAKKDGVINDTRCFVIRSRIVNNLTLENIAERCSFTREWIRQLQNKALKDLNNYLHN